MRGVLGVLGLLLLATFSMGASCSVHIGSSPGIASVVLSKDTKQVNGAYTPVNQTTTFASTDTIHAVISANDLKDNSDVRIVWTAVNAGPSQNVKIYEDTQTVSGSHT